VRPDDSWRKPLEQNSTVVELSFRAEVERNWNDNYPIPDFCCTVGVGLIDNFLPEPKLVVELAAVLISN
jgi:hypothetical protein